MEGNVVTYGLVALATLVYVLRWLKPSRSSLPDIPAVTPTAPILSFYGVFKYFTHSREMIQEGYDKYKGRAFKIPEVFRWMVIVTGPKLIEELRKAPDDTLSFEEATRESLQVDYTLGPAIHHNGYHIGIVRSNLTRNLAALFPDVRDEIVAAFTEAIPLSDDWISVPALETVMQIVCRTSNRIFVGLPKCRDLDYRKLNIQFTVDVVKGAMILNLLPTFVRPLAARIFTNVPSSIDRGMKHLEPIIRQRYQAMEEYGSDYPDKPNDMLSWFMDEAKGEEREVRALVLRILTVNFAAIHTSSMSFTHALYRLAANPEYILPMREEVESIVKAEGWTKAAMGKMRKVDSFLKESQRYHGLGAISITRRALRDFTFSDGTFIPKGEFVSAAAMPTHYDEEYYENPEVFNPWRFAEMRSEDGEGTKHQMVSTSSEYIPFGHGKHACPGRFFAANELKAMLAHVVTTYDVKLENEGVVPEPLWVASALVPNPTAKVMFRKRQD
ncbi:unnamed protein product [Somion occarium]|uniref:Cytochrome P450 n=1 Tax=Somion occarium TaxID=3059160 RepID=A0ABP1D7M3_9APHY